LQSYFLKYGWIWLDACHVHPLQVGVDSLRAADEDLLQGNPGVFAIRHISAFGCAPGCEKCFKKGLHNPVL